MREVLWWQWEVHWDVTCCGFGFVYLDQVDKLSVDLLLGLQC